MSYTFLKPGCRCMTWLLSIKGAHRTSGGGGESSHMEENSGPLASSVQGESETAVGVAAAPSPHKDSAADGGVFLLTMLPQNTLTPPSTLTFKPCSVALPDYPY